MYDTDFEEPAAPRWYDPAASPPATNNFESGNVFIGHTSNVLDVTQFGSVLSNPTGNNITGNVYTSIPGDPDDASGNLISSTPWSTFAANNSVQNNFDLDADPATGQSCFPSGEDEVPETIACNGRTFTKPIWWNSVFQ